MSHPAATAPRILLLSGSTRRGSYNTMLARLADEAVRRAGGEPTLITLKDYRLPIYDGDEESEHGIPAAAMELKRLFKAHHGLFITSPENNASVSALLKNTIDWISRATPSENGKVPFRGKVVALAGATTGTLGTHRGLLHLRQVLSVLGSVVLPEPLGIAHAAAAFDEAGRLRDEAQVQLLDALAASLVDTAGRIGVVS